MSAGSSSLHATFDVESEGIWASVDDSFHLFRTAGDMLSVFPGKGYFTLFASASTGSSSLSPTIRPLRKLCTLRLVAQRGMLRGPE